mmetsp:Transcript_23525/g.38338  ORF Transcript_23525/g.38338 Transcript_23525/m.38338 type:complete len:286 (+) Transcript_23525:1216-2073(+)
MYNVVLGAVIHRGKKLIGNARNVVGTQVLFLLGYVRERVSPCTVFRNKIYHSGCLVDGKHFETVVISVQFSQNIDFALQNFWFDRSIQGIVFKLHPFPQCLTGHCILIGVIGCWYLPIAFHVVHQCHHSEFTLAKNPILGEPCMIFLLAAVGVFDQGCAASTAQTSSHICQQIFYNRRRASPVYVAPKRGCLLGVQFLESKRRRRSCTICSASALVVFADSSVVYRVKGILFVWITKGHDTSNGHTGYVCPSADKEQSNWVDSQIRIHVASRSMYLKPPDSELQP